MAYCSQDEHDGGIHSTSDSVFDIAELGQHSGAACDGSDSKVDTEDHKLPPTKDNVMLAGSLMKSPVDVLLPLDGVKHEMTISGDDVLIYTPSGSTSRHPDMKSDMTEDTTNPNALSISVRNQSTSSQDSSCTTRKTAGEKVFATYELVEKILLSQSQLNSIKSLKTILLAQRVNKTFKYVIQRSFELQRVLFFKPSRQEPQAVPGQATVHWNPFFEPTARRVGNYVDTGGHKTVWLYAKPDDEYRGFLLCGYSKCLAVLSSSQETYERVAVDVPVTHQSWQHMHLFKQNDRAGMYQVFLGLIKELNGGLAWQDDSVLLSQDCTMGSVYEKMLKFRRVAGLGSVI